MITVVHVRQNPFTLYIGRSYYQDFPEDSKWHNPFHASRWGRFKCLEMYEDYIRKYLWDDLHELDDQILGCWCKPKECHGDVLKRLRQEQLNALRGETVSG